jgi:hypothetical protein
VSRATAIHALNLWKFSTVRFLQSDAGDLLDFYRRRPKMVDLMDI